MEKRLLIAVLLSIVVMYGYSFLFMQTSPNKSARLQKPVQQQVSAVLGLPMKDIELTPQKRPAVLVGEKDVVVDTELYTAVFSTSGASLKKLVLKKYNMSTDPNAKQISLIDENSPETYSLHTIGNGLPINQTAVYSATVDTLQLKKGDKKSLEFVTKSEKGDYLKKTYTFTGDSYAIGLEQQVRNVGSTQQQGVLQLVEKNH